MQLNEHTGGVNAFGADLNTRTSMDGDRNEIVALRFDLSEHALASVSDVKLNIINSRNNSARRVALYGVRQGTMGSSGLFSTEDWPEGGLGFADMPGLLAPDGDFLTQSLDEANLVPLGQITFANLTKGTVETFSGPDLTEFIRGYTGSKLITFLLAAAPGYTSTGQARFASKEASSLEGGDPAGEPGDFAPTLVFRVVSGSTPPRITGVTRAGNQLTVQWSGGTGPFRVQRKATVEGGAWTDVLVNLNGTSAAVSMEGSAGFLRIGGQ
jgi:hypothetical protein